MVIVGLLSWWYTAGWVQRFRYMGDKLSSMYDYFSFDLLLRTLFSPFRQISAGSVQGPLPVMLRAFVDRLISRIIGSIVRTIVIIIGLFAITLTTFWNLLVVVAWGLVPLLPFIGLGLMLSGWVPWQI